MISKVKKLADQYFDEITEVRRHVHAHPELSFQEFETAEFYSSKLEELDIPFKRIANTGIVGIIKGKNPDKKNIALRGDIDALPITETNDISYRSRNEGVMHACGHDVHSSCLLGAAKIINELKEEFEGSVKLLFQPGEEKLPGGASIMIREGALEDPKPSKIYGQHVMPELEVGTLGFKPGMFMASADEIYITVKGKGGHAAMPDRLIDPILISAHLITSLQQVVSRKAPSLIPSVLSFGDIHGSGATNVIPDQVSIKGTFRTFDEDWRAKAHEHIYQITKGLVESMGAQCDIDIQKGYPTLINDEEATVSARKRAVDYLGEDKVVDLDLRSTAEDFAYFSQAAPSCFYRLGIANEVKGIKSALHTNTFNIDEDALLTGMGFMAYCAIEELKA